MKLSEAEVVDFLQSIERGEVAVKPAKSPSQHQSGDLAFEASNGWHVTVFIDAGEWDYVDRVISDDGRTASFDDIWDTMPTVREWPERGADLLKHLKAWGFAW